MHNSNGRYEIQDFILYRRGLRAEWGGIRTRYRSRGKSSRLFSKGNSEKICKDRFIKGAFEAEFHSLRSLAEGMTCRSMRSRGDEPRSVGWRML